MLPRRSRRWARSVLTMRKAPPPEPNLPDARIEPRGFKGHWQRASAWVRYVVTTAVVVAVALGFLVGVVAFKRALRGPTASDRYAAQAREREHELAPYRQRCPARARDVPPARPGQAAGRSAGRRAGGRGVRRHPRAGVPARARPPGSGAEPMRSSGRPAGAGAHPRRQPDEAPSRHRAGHRGAVHAVPVPLAARRACHPAARRRRPARPGGAVAGLACARRRLGGVDPGRPVWSVTTRATDRVGHAGLVTWGRLSLPTDPAGSEPADAGPGPGPARRASRTTAITLCTRADLGWLSAAARGDQAPTIPVGTVDWRSWWMRCASGVPAFLRELAGDTGHDHATVEAALWDGVARGVLSADSFWALRSLFASRRPDRSDGGAAVLRPSPTRGRLRARGAAGGRAPGEGRWALLPPPPAHAEPDELAEAVAEQLLCRWGVVFRDLAVREQLVLPWREIQWALRRLEAPRHDPRRPIRQRLQRRAVRPAGSGGRAGPGPQGERRGGR